MHFAPCALSVVVHLSEDRLIVMKMSDREIHKQTVTEETKGSNSWRGVSLAKRSKDQIVCPVVQNDLLEGLVNEDMFHGGTEHKNGYEISKRKLLPPH